MAFCKKFIHGVNSIKFAQQDSKLIKASLYALVYEELQLNLKAIEALVKDLPVSVEDFRANEQLELYRRKQGETLEHLKDQIQSIQEIAALEGINLETAVEVNAEFLRAFAANFRNIRHLADTLADAPGPVKDQQTRLYTEILFKLDKAEQERQLQTLSLSNLQDMVQQAVAIYDNNKDQELVSQARTLVQMAIYEIVRRELNQVKPEALEYDQYQAIIGTLKAKIPDVAQSTVIDNLSDYRATDGKTLADLLLQWEQSSKLKLEGAILSEAGIDALQQRKALFHRLRFGQEDRREYAEKLQTNLARDLFWARNIRDVELFTKSGHSDGIFAGICQRRFIENSKFLERPNPKYSNRSSAIARLATVIDILREESKAHQEESKEQPRQESQRGKIAKSVKPQNIKHYVHFRKDGAKHPETKLALMDKIGEKFSKPTMVVNAEIISINFYFAQLDEKALGLIIDGISGPGGFGSTTESILNYYSTTKQNTTLPVFSTTVTGKTFAEIRSQLKEEKLAEDRKAKQLKPPHNDERLALVAAMYEAYNEQLDKLEAEFNLEVQKTRDSGLGYEKLQNPVINDIKDLNLGNSDEILFRQVLELFSIRNLEAIQNDNVLAAAFGKIKEGKFHEALKIADLELHVQQAYSHLATIPRDSVQEHARPIIDKAANIVASSKQRKDKLERLEQAFQSQSSMVEKVQAVQAVFLEEYQEMSSTLGLSQDDNRLAQAIQTMAAELVQLMDRTQRGEPAITTAEERMYFSVLQQIATQIQPRQLSEVYFKVPVQLQNSLKVATKDGQEIEVSIDLKGGKLPYSLIKPPGSNEVIFSYGGSRGVIAPFAGLEEAYAGKDRKKNRFFTHSRLLGVGQYGSVKEVESLLTGLNQVVKKGYVPGNQATFTEASRADLRTRPLTSREDPSYRIESDVLQNLSQAEASRQRASGSTQYWIKQDKQRQKGALYANDSRPNQYQLLTERAKGETFADTGNQTLNKYSKADETYHNPVKRPEDRKAALKRMLSLSDAIVAEGERLFALGFTHNDLKPENFCYKENADGSYQIRYIDWATGGFQRVYQGQGQDLKAIFAEIYGSDLKLAVEEANNIEDAKGRFVQRLPDQSIVYGVKPVLEILHGSRQGTLPYISPQVLGEERRNKCVAGGVEDKSLDTRLRTMQEQTAMDNWALTAMTFGICSRQAYFALVKGRAVSDYIVPGILEVDNANILGLKIANIQKFNEYFSCGAPLTEDDLKTGKAYNDSKAVMYIPSNQREGEPLHLYRRLQDLKQELQQQAQQVDSPEQKIITRIDSILAAVYNAVSEGTGLSKEQLRKKIQAAEQCLKDYEKLHDKSHQQAQSQIETLQGVLKQYQGKEIDPDSLLASTDAGLSQLQVLCTFPTTKVQKEEAIAVLNEAFKDEMQLVDKFIAKGAPGRIQQLFKECIAHGQPEILISLLNKITQDNPDFYELVAQQGLLHYAAQEGMTDVFEVMVKALERAHAGKEYIFELMMERHASNLENGSLPYIKWATDCFHIAVRNNNKQLLLTILDYLPPGNEYDRQISEALHLSASLGNKVLYQEILERCRLNLPYENYAKQASSLYPFEKNESGKGFDAARIVNLKLPPEHLSPFQLFMRDEGTLDAIDWEALSSDKDLARQFLFSDENSPALIAAAKGNFAGLRKLIRQLGPQLSQDEWQEFLTQTDANGKNLLNHILEHRQFDFLPEFLKVIEDHLKENSADVLIKLLGNPNPVNPLRNFLNQPLNSNHQFNIATMLLDAICGDFAKATPEQQQARIVALLLNKEWLIAQASVQDNHDRLVKLLQNGALSVTYKKILFEALQAASAQNPEALKLYGKLLQQVAPEAPKVLEQKAELEIAAIFTEFARQDSNIHQLLNALTAEKSTLKELKEEKQILELQVARYAQSVQETTKQLKEHEEALKAMEATLQDTQMAFEEAQKRSLELTTQIEETNRLHEVEVERLKGDVLQSRSEAQAQLELAQQTHEKALGALRSELSQVQDSSQQLSLKLEQEQAGLEERTHELLELKSQFEDLGQERERLLSELSEARLNSEREKQEREELIRQVEAESQKQVQSEEKLRQLESSLSTLEKDNERLESQLQELQKQNAGFENQVQDLELQVARYAQSVQETTKQLKEHEEALKAMEATLQDTQMAFEEAQKRSLELTTQIEETNRLHEVEVERLKGDVLQSRSEAQAQLELAQQTHEKALGALRSELSQVQDSSQQLSLKLEQEQAGLEERTHELLELKSQFEDLGQERERLLSELSEARLNSEREKQEREELIRQVEAESQKQVQSEEKLRQLESSLSTLEKDNERLESQLQELQKQNAGFENQVQDLELQVARYAQSVQETTKQLKEHEEALKAMEATLQDTQMAFEEAQKRSLELTTQIEETNRLHEVEVERLKGDVLQSRSEAQAQLELAQQTHEKALGALRSELSQVQDSSQQLSLKLEQEQAGLEERTHELLELKSQFEDLGQERERLLSELSEARLNSEREKQEREELIRQVEAESQKQVQSEEKLRQLESSLSTLEKDNERLESQLQELQRQNEEFGAEIGNLKDQLKLATFERDSERQRANKAEEDLRAEQEKSKDLDNQLAEARRLIETMRKEMEELREKQQLQEEENKRQEEAVAAAKKEVDLRAKQLEEKEEALNVREKDVVRREEAAKEVEEQLASREQAVNIRERDLEQLTQEREEFQQEQEKFKQEREEFQQEREEFQQEREEFQQEQEKFKQEREEFQQEREEFQQEQEKFKQEREEFQQERKEFQQELEKFQQEREKFQQEREEFEKEKEELARVKEDNSALKKENELLTAQLEMLREALDAQGIEMDPKIMAQRQAIKLLTAQLKISKDDELLTKVKESDSNQDLKGAGLDSKLVANLMDEDAYTVLVPVAEERLRQLNDERIETRRKILASATYQDVLSDGEKELRGIYDNLAYLNKLDKTIQNELRDLAGSSPLDWFNPAFQSAAKEHAAEMYPHFEKLAGGCDTIVNYLKTLKVELNHQLACMPADLSSVDSVTQRKIIEHHKAKLTRYLSWVDNNLSLYEPLHKRLFGDDTAVDNPLLRLGVLNLLKQSMENKYRAQFLCFNSSYIDYPLAQRAAHFDSQYQAQVDNIPKPTGLQAKGEGRAIYHKLVGDAEKGFFREHVINPGEDTEACFLEEHNKHSKLDAEGNELISQEVSYYLTLNKFPQPSQHISPDELNKARVRVALAMATQMLADLGRAPTKDKPIILESHDYEEARYLFTALMLLGKKTPGMHFDFDAIVVLSEVFNPKQELQEDPLYRIKKSFGLSKFKYDFVANSCYETCFKQDPALDQMLAALQEAGEQQAAQKTKKEQTKASVTRVTSFFANGKTTQGEDFLEKLRQENQVKGPRSGG